MKGAEALQILTRLGTKGSDRSTELLVSTVQRVLNLNVMYFYGCKNILLYSAIFSLSALLSMATISTSAILSASGNGG